MTSGIARGLLLLGASALLTRTSPAQTPPEDSAAAYDLVARGDGFAPARVNPVLRFEHSGTRLALAAGGETLTLEPVAWGRAGVLAAVETAEVAVDGPRAELRRGDLVEWYASAPAGLEQGFTLERRPPGADDEVVVEMRWQGDLLPLVDTSERDMRFVSPGAVVAFGYTGLRAWDATGRELAARLTVDGDRLSLRVEDAGATYPVVIDPLCAVEQAELRASDAGSSDGFGYFVAVDGNTAVVGSYRDNHGAGSDAGSAYVYTRSGSTWTERAKLVAADASPDDRFGRSVAIQGGTIVVGAYHDDDLGSNAGSVYVFTGSGATWTQQAKLLPGDGAAGDQFGSEVAIQGNTLVAGAPTHDGAAAAAGAAYVFVRVGSSWSQQAKLLSSDLDSGDLLGRSVSISNETIVVGAPSAGIPGAAYVFVRAGSTWSQQAKLVPAGGGSGQFGTSVSISQDRIAVGAPLDDLPGISNCGSAYVFVRGGSTWTQETRLLAGDPAVDDRLGYSVAISDDGTCPRVLAGAPNGASGAPDPGATYLFARNGAWAQFAKLVPSDAVNGDSQGFAVAIQGTTGVTSSIYHSAHGVSSAGSAYAWDFSDTVQPLLHGCADFTACTGPGGGNVTYPVFATDNCDPIPSLVCTPPSGSFLTPGSHMVTCTATDCAGNSTTCSFTVCVDTAPPTFVAPLPMDETFDCTSPLGSLIFYDCPSAIDDCDQDVEVECDPPSGSFVPPGITTVTCTATDDCGRETIYTFTITLIPDTTPPVVTCPDDITMECDQPGGADVAFTATAVDDCDGPVAVTCSPAPGFFPVGGPYTVTCTATDSKGNQGSCTFEVTVEDTTPPDVDCPEGVTLECGDPVAFTASASDVCDPSPTVVYDPAPGGTAGQGQFLLGPTMVTFTATDECGNSDDCSFVVTVIDSTPPVVDLPGVPPVEATGPDGAVVSFTVTASDACDMGMIPVDCSPASGSLFPLGTTTVTCTATDAEGNTATVTFDVVVRDTTPPDVDCPENVQVPCAGTDGTAVSYSATATDLVDPAPEITFDPASGSLFPVGDTTVTCTATDAEGNAASCTFVVTVEDTTAPMITCPEDMTVECNGLDGTPVTFAPVATDDCAGMPAIVCAPASGSLFPGGATTVTCTATDDAGNEATCTFVVTVEDTTAPALACPPVTVECQGPAGAVALYAPAATDGCDPAPAVVCSPPSGTELPHGTTVVTCTATDASGNQASCAFPVQVVDTTPPVVQCPGDILASGGTGASVTYTATASDLCDPAPALVCNPPSGSFFPIGSTTVTCTATDADGNTSVCTFLVTVTNQVIPVMDDWVLSLLAVGMAGALAVFLARKA